LLWSLPEHGRSERARDLYADRRGNSVNRRAVADEFLVDI
jgi:hypothetical protein